MKQKFIYFLIFCVFFFGLFSFLNSPSQQYSPAKQNLALPDNSNNITTDNSSPSFFSQLLPKSNQPITIIAVGDIMLGRAVNARMQKNNDFISPFILTVDYLKSADLTFGNLESPFFDNCPITNTGMVFCADYKAVEGLKSAGFDVLNLANNHIYNYGETGLNQTITLLNNNSIHPVGSLNSHLNDIYHLSIKGTKLAFIGYNLLSSYKLEEIKKEVGQTKKRVDILILSLHWGNEYQTLPSTAQKEIAHQLVDSGADLIVGHHPHVIQPTEEYNSKLILYSLGNFVFDQPWSEPTKKGLVAKITFENNKITKTEFKQIYIKNLIQPEFTEEAAK